MKSHQPNKISSLPSRALSLFIAVTFLSQTILPPAYAQVLNLPAVGTMVNPSAAFVPVLLKGMTVYPDNPLRFDFIVDSGNTKFSPDQVKEESNRLVKYFLAAMTVPQDDLWVNLSPYEADRIIPDALGKTELGRDMLAQDYLLKQLSASLLSPDKDLGKDFWARVYKKTQAKFGTTNIPVNTFNKVWIMPDEATVYENGNAVYIVKSRLKVMLDEDYQAMQNNKNARLGTDKMSDAAIKDAASLSSQVVREIILPEIEREVNEGENFAPIRQIYQSLILAQWYKETVKASLLSKVYIDQKKIKGVDLTDPTVKDRIYAQYVEAFKKGVFNFIKKDYDETSQQPIPRKYFSGGEKFGRIALKRTNDVRALSSAAVGDDYQLALKVEPAKVQGQNSPAGEAGKNSWVQSENIREIRDEQGRLLAPNGELSKLPVKLWKLVRTDTFKKWFGDWENPLAEASKIVDENGEPLVMRHVSGAKFTEFQEAYVNAYDYKSLGGRPRLPSGLGSGVCFTTRPEVWDKFDDSKETFFYEVFLNLRNPAFIDQKDFKTNPEKTPSGEEMGALRTKFSELRDKVGEISEADRQEMQRIHSILKEVADEVRARAQKEGRHDGSLDRPINEVAVRLGKDVPRPSKDTYAVNIFNPGSGAIKSIDNAGTFDASNPDIFERNNVSETDKGTSNDAMARAQYYQNDQNRATEDDPQIQSGQERLSKMAEEHPEQRIYLGILAKMLPELHPRKRRHVVNVMENFYKITSGNYAGLYEALDDKAKHAASSEEYTRSLNKVKTLYDGLSEQEKKLFPVIAMLHDIGSREGQRDWTHNQFGADMIPAVLGNIREMSPEDILFIKKMIYLHGAIADVGIDFFPEEVLSLPPNQQKMLFIFSVMDISARQDGVNQASKQFIDYNCNKYEQIIPLMANRRIFVERRLGSAFTPFPISQSTLEERIVVIKKYLNEQGTPWDVFETNWSLVRVYDFDIFNRLLNRSVDSYVKLVDQISKKISAMKRQGEFVDVVIDDDVDYMGLPFGGPQSGLRDEYISIIAERLNQNQEIIFSTEIKDGRLYLVLQLDKMRGESSYGKLVNDYSGDLTKVSSPGGITMNRINVDRQGNGVDIQFDPAVMQDIMQNGVEGFAPVIINLTPIPSILPLFGLDPANKEDEYAAVASLN